MVAASEPEKNTTKTHLFSYLSTIVMIKTILFFLNKQNWGQGETSFAQMVNNYLNIILEDLLGTGKGSQG